MTWYSFHTPEEFYTHAFRPFGSPWRCNINKRNIPLSFEHAGTDYYPYHARFVIQIPGGVPGPVTIQAANIIRGHVVEDNPLFDRWYTIVAEDMFGTIDLPRPTVYEWQPNEYIFQDYIFHSGAGDIHVQRSYRRWVWRPFNASGHNEIGLHQWLLHDGVVQNTSPLNFVAIASRRRTIEPIMYSDTNGFTHFTRDPNDDDRVATYDYWVDSGFTAPIGKWWL